jgi:hypothetical protein
MTKCSRCHEEGHNSRNKKKCKKYLNSVKDSLIKESEEIIEENANIVEKNIVMSKSKNSLVASSGNRAENILCDSNKVLEILGTQYFNKRIIKCEKIHGKKSDVRFIFVDGSQTTAQLKNGNGGGRGWSFDRRDTNNMPTNDSVKELLKIVCLKVVGERKVIKMDKNMIEKLLLGDDINTSPQHFIHTSIMNENIQSLSVCPASKFLDTILNELYETFNSKRTCVHLTPLIYLQRKGGGKKDNSPNDIQAKLRKMPDCMTNIKLD